MTVKFKVKLTVGIFILVGSVIWWAATLTSDVKYVKSEISEIKTVLKSIDTGNVAYGE